MSDSKDDVEKVSEELKKSSPSEKLTYDRLINLLQCDQLLRQLIHSIVEQTRDSDQRIFDNTDLKTEGQQENHVEVVSTHGNRYIQSDMTVPSESVLATPDIKEPLRAELSSVLRLLALVEEHENLNRYLSDGSASEGQRLVRLLVNLGRWEQIEMIWETLAADIKQRQQAMVPDELEILEGCMQCFNLSNSQFRAALDQPELPQKFNHKVHNRLNAKGKRATLIALPGLINPAGDCVKKVLVITE
jgi:hypothetical protein